MNDGKLMSAYQQLQDRIERQSAKIGIIGLGYVGLPMAVRAARAGVPALGFDVEVERVDRVNIARSYIGDVPSSELRDLLVSGRLSATTDYARLEDCDVIIVCVPTPLNDH